MSLLDAILPEPYRDPRVVWIARRGDGQVGSGTVDDPYDGSTVSAEPIRLTSLTNTGSEATAITDGKHGFQDGEVVTIAGVEGAGVGGVPAEVWNGAFVVYATSAVSFKYLMANAPATAPALTADASAARWIYRFDEVMRTVPANAAVFVGPGVFETRGFNPGRAAPMDRLNWIIRAGQRIVGSGMGATTLKLVHAEPFFAFAQLTTAIGHGAFAAPHFSANADDAEVSDLTIDCDMRSQPGHRVAKAAIWAGGRNVRIHRVRAIDFCTQFGSANGSTECFVITTAGADPRTSPAGADPASPFTERVDCRIEDCVLEEPGANGLFTITGFLLSSGENPSTGEMGWHRACILRNNYANLEYQDNSVSIAAITLNGAEAVVTTRTPHGRKTGDSVVISGALVNGSSLNTFNGSYSIIRESDFAFKYTPVNYSQFGLPTTAPTGEMWVGRHSSRTLHVVKLEVAAPLPTRRIKLTTFRPHNRLPGQYANLEGVFVGGLPDPRFNDRFEIKSVLSPVELEFDIKADLSSSPNFTFAGMIGSALQVLSAEGGSEAVAEGNSILHCRTGGPYHDTWSSKDVTVRNNYNYDVLAGPLQTLRPGVTITPGAFVALKSLTHSGDTATAETFLPHGLRGGIDLVHISGASVTAYNGANLPVTAATATTFQYPLGSDPGGPASNARYVIRELKAKLTLLEVAADVDGYYATATTSGRHGFLKGDGVQILKTGLVQYPGSTYLPDSNLFDGLVTVTQVLDDYRFRYRLPANPGVDSSNPAFSSGYFARIWQSRLSVYEGNWFELSSRFGDGEGPVGISMVQSDPDTFVVRTDPYAYQQMIARGNLARSVDGRYGVVNTSYSTGVRFVSCEQALIERNLIDVGSSNQSPIGYASSGVVQTARNQGFDGKAIPGVQFQSNALSQDLAARHSDDLAARVGTALLISLL